MRITPFDISPYISACHGRRSISERFYAVSQILDDVDRDRRFLLEKGIGDDLIRQRQSAAHDFMVSVMEEVDYSDHLKCTVKQVGIASAEKILMNPFIAEACNSWKDMEKGDLQQVASVTHKTVASVIQGLGYYWSSASRHTTVTIVNEGPQLCLDGVERTLGGTISLQQSLGIPDKEVQIEKISVNMHKQSHITHNVNWLSVLVHENIHAMEGLLRMCASYVWKGDPFYTDTQVALADQYRPLQLSTRAYETYHALPSERLARLGQAAFVQRIMAG